MSTSEQPSPAAARAAPFNQKLATQVQKVVLQRIEAGTLEFPIIPAVGARLAEALRKPDAPTKGLASLVEQDVLLALRVLRQATLNQPGGSRKFPSVAEALTRLGPQASRSLLSDAAARRSFLSRNTKIAEMARRNWQHSVAVAIVARDISALAGGTDDETAYLAGLFHDLGKPVVVTVLLEAERQIAELRSMAWIEPAEWAWVLRQTARQVGVSLAEKWGLPPAIAHCVRDVSEYDPADRGAASNAVTFANAFVKTVGFGSDNEDLDDAKALVMIGRSMLGVDDAILERLADVIKTRLGTLYD